MRETSAGSTEARDSQGETQLDCKVSPRPFAATNMFLLSPGWF